jgi:hypothetical protein
MNARFQSSASKPAGATALFDAAAHTEPAPRSADQACCCVARAVVRVVMPPAPGRPHETELLLCGHHYRVSRQALVAAHARVDELPGDRADTAAWFDGKYHRAADSGAVASDQNPRGADLRP